MPEQHQRPSKENTLSRCHDASGDGFGQLLAEGGRTTERSFSGVGEEAAFHENGGVARIAQDVEGAPFDTPVLRPVGFHQLGLDSRGGFGGGAGIVKRLVSARSLAGGGVEMDAYQKRISA